MTRLNSVLRETLKIGVAAWSITWTEPWVAQLLPQAVPAVTYLLAALCTALVFETLLQIVCGRPQIEVRWTDAETKDKISEIAANFSPRTNTSQPFQFDLQLPEQGWLGFQILKWLTGKGLVLEITVQTVDVFPTREYSSKVSPGGKLAVKPIDSKGGFYVELENPPLRPGRWHYAVVRWENQERPGGEGFNVDYNLRHTCWILERISQLVVKCTSNVRSFRVIGY